MSLACAGAMLPATNALTISSPAKNLATVRFSFMETSCSVTEGSGVPSCL